MQSSSSTTTILPLSEFQVRYHDLNLETTFIEIRCPEASSDASNSTTSSSMSRANSQFTQWHRLKSLQKYNQASGPVPRKLKLQLYFINGENTGAGSFKVFWNSDTVVEISFIRDHPLKVRDEDLCDLIDSSDEDSGHEPPPSATPVQTMKLDTLDLNRISDPLLLQVIDKFRLDNHLIRTLLPAVNNMILQSMEVSSIVAFLMQLNTLHACFLLPSDLATQPWLIPAAKNNTITTSELQLWVAVEERIAMLSMKLIISITILSCTETQNSNNNLQASQAWLDAAFCNNGVLIAQAFRQELEEEVSVNYPNNTLQEQEQRRKSLRFHINPYSASNSLCFLTGEVRVSESGLTFDSHMTDANAVQYSDLCITMPLPDPQNLIASGTSSWWNPYFECDEDATFALQVMSSYLFRKQHCIPTSEKKQILILECCSTLFAEQLEIMFIAAFKRYVLFTNDNFTPAQLHSFYRFAFSNLTVPNMDKKNKNNTKHDVTRGLAASIPHIILCSGSAMEEINFSGHQPPFIITMKNFSSGIPTTMPNLTFMTNQFVTVLLSFWQQPRELFTVIDPAFIPRSILLRQEDIIVFSAAAVLFIQKESTYQSSKQMDTKMKTLFSTPQLELCSKFTRFIKAEMAQGQMPFHSDDTITLYETFVLDHLYRLGTSNM